MPASASIHALNITTLATWLSVAAFGAVGMTLGRLHPGTEPTKVDESVVTMEQDFEIGEPVAPDAVLPDAAQDTAEATLPEALPAPPEMAPAPTAVPLPELPPLPAPVASTPEPAPRAPSSTAVVPNTPDRPRQTTSQTRQTRSGNSTAAGQTQAQASRIAAGRMPAPSYPADARRKGQSGTVVVEFTVDHSGRVIAARAKQPSPHASLNQEAVRTVRQWRFPPGGIMILERPITFKLE